MNPEERSVLERYNTAIIDAMSVTITPFLAFFRANGIINRGDVDFIDHQSPTGREKAAKLLDILRTRESGWNALLFALREQKLNELADDLSSQIDKPSTEAGSDVPLEQLQKSALETWRVQLEDYIASRAFSVIVECSEANVLTDAELDCLQSNSDTSKAAAKTLIDVLEAKQGTAWWYDFIDVLRSQKLTFIADKLASTLKATSGNLSGVPMKDINAAERAADTTSRRTRLEESKISSKTV